jgi:hypothetical protein
MDLVPFEKKTLTRTQFEQLANIPPEDEWLANITNLKTRRAWFRRPSSWTNSDLFASKIAA